ncbi:MAG: hypothetical protein AMXMBFR58_37390 [Phycisphaerae bacterium]
MSAPQTVQATVLDAEKTIGVVVLTTDGATFQKNPVRDVSYLNEPFIITPPSGVFTLILTLHGNPGEPVPSTVPAEMRIAAEAFIDAANRFASRA